MGASCYGAGLDFYSLVTGQTRCEHNQRSSRSSWNQHESASFFISSDSYSLTYCLLSPSLRVYDHVISSLQRNNTMYGKEKEALAETLNEMFI